MMINKARQTAIVTGMENPDGLGAIIGEYLVGVGYNVANIPGAAIRSGKTAINAEVAQLVVSDIAVVVNNFGINHLSWIGTTPENDEDILRINVMGPYWVVDALINRGATDVRCINIASQTYRVAQRCSAIYCASKAALVQMTRVMARELAKDGWVINALAPGKILNTTMTQLTDRQVLELRGWDSANADKYAKGLIPQNRFTTCDEVAKAVTQIIGLPKYITGTVIDMTGGV